MQDLDVIFSTPMDSYIRGSVSGLPAVFKGILTHLPWQARGSVLFFYISCSSGYYGVLRYIGGDFTKLW